MGLGPSVAETSTNTYSILTGQIKPIKVGYTWTIHNFRTYCNRMSFGQSITSPIFLVGLKNYKWRLILYPCGDNEENKNYVSLYLKLVHDGDGTNLAVNTLFSLSIIDVDGNEVHKRRTIQKRCFVKIKTIWGFERFISRDQLLTTIDNKLLHGPEKSGRLTIYFQNCDTEMTSDIPTECNLLHVAISDNLHKLSSDFNNFFNSHRFCDFTIFAGEESREFPVHKVILAARSPVFAAMFEHDMQEKNQKYLIVKDVRSQIMNEMLRFIYSGNVENLEDCVHELLVVANMYALEDLTEMCGEVLYNSLTIENACELLVFADLHNACKLKTRINAYLIDNSKAIAETQSFKNALNEHPRLIAEVFQNMALQK